MDKLSKIDISVLKDIYGAMLTGRQSEVLQMYCDCDCSLGEIAEQTGISRQGVRDAIVNGEKTLVNLENKLHLLADKRKRMENLAELKAHLNNDDCQKALQVVDKMIFGE